MTAEMRTSPITMYCWKNECRPLPLLWVEVVKPGNRLLRASKRSSSLEIPSFWAGLDAIWVGSGGMGKGFLPRIPPEPTVHLFNLIIPHSAHFTSSPTCIKRNLSSVVPMSVYNAPILVHVPASSLGTRSLERIGSLGQQKEHWTQHLGSSRFRCLWAVWPQANHFTTLNFHVLIYIVRSLDWISQNSLPGQFFGEDWWLWVM